MVLLSLTGPGPLPLPDPWGSAVEVPPTSGGGPGPALAAAFRAHDIPHLDNGHRAVFKVQGSEWVGVWGPGARRRPAIHAAAGRVGSRGVWGGGAKLSWALRGCRGRTGRSGPFLVPLWPHCGLHWDGGGLPRRCRRAQFLPFILWNGAAPGGQGAAEWGFWHPGSRRRCLSAGPGVWQGPGGGLWAPQLLFGARLFGGQPQRL